MARIPRQPPVLVPVWQQKRASKGRGLSALGDRTTCRGKGVPDSGGVGMQLGSPHLGVPGTQETCWGVLAFSFQTWKFLGKLVSGSLKEHKAFRVHLNPVAK